MSQKGESEPEQNEIDYFSERVLFDNLSTPL